MTTTERDRVLAMFRELVAIDNPTFGERAMADEVKRRLASLGLSALEDDTFTAVGGSAGNLLARVPGTLDLPPLLFSAHMDSVPPAVGKRLVLRGDGRITSDGTTVLGSDDLAGITEILCALAMLRESGAEHRPLELLFTYGEEVYTAGSSRFDYGQLQAREAYVLDDSGAIGTYLYQAPSLVSFAAEFVGKAAHAGFCPEEGVHAIAMAAEAIARTPLGRMDNGVTVNIGRIAGGTATNIVPARCSVKGETRSFDNGLAVSAVSGIKATFADVARGRGGALEFASDVTCLAYKIDRASPVIRRFERVCRERGLAAKGERSFGCSDNNCFAQHGIDGIVLACGMMKPHSLDEYIDLADLTAATELVLALMASRD